MTTSGIVVELISQKGGANPAYPLGC